MDTISPRRTANLAVRQYFQVHGPATEQNAEWVEKSELPSEEELVGSEGITDNDVLLQPNRITQPWRSTREYMRAHYALLREDSVAPLRDAVTYIRADPSMVDIKDVVVYDRVHIGRVTMAQGGMAFRIRFSTQRAGKKILWKYSSRLLAGSVVALSPAKDSFKSKCAVATVAARPLDLVSNYPHQVDIYFATPEDIDFDPQTEWIMVESRVGYFEAYRHTLTALQKLYHESFPLSNHICHLDTNIPVSDSIRESPSFDFQCLTGTSSEVKSSYNVLTDLPTTPLGSLNDIQWQALKEMLTQKLALIQGPPGTGKTHISVIALKILLANMVAGEPPIIIAAHTNHALDQLLRQVAYFEKDYIRLGGRCKDLEICQRTLYSVRRSLNPRRLENGLLEPATTEYRHITAEIVELFKPLENELVCMGPLSAATFLKYGLLTQEQFDSMAQETNAWMTASGDQRVEPFKEWLGDQIELFEPNYGEENENSIWDDIDAEYEQLQELEAEQGPDNEDYEGLKGRSVTFTTSFCGKKREVVPEETIELYLQSSDFSKVPTKHRGSLYNHLRAKLFQILRQHVCKLASIYAEVSKDLRIGRWERDHEILRAAKLVAMTTTGLSKYRGLVASLNPKIVVIEEAAEVIEAPVAAACFESLQQLILVGDHKQLKGQCSMHDLAGSPFFLDVSMFERLIANNLPFIMLREQRRMIPEISELLRPIYGELQNHPSVTEYPPIPGMGSMRSYFFDHQWPEDGDSLSSKLNDMEAVMTVGLYTYLLMNGTPSSAVTILTFYNGQRKLLLKLLRTNRVIAQRVPNVVTVDSYQGEENDIILASLVRSNSSRGIGFLAVDNRVCVALSRAKRGFFIFGNSKLLSSVSPLWRRVIDIFAADGDSKRIGSTLKLTCDRHGSHMEVKVPGDWQQISGGCDMACGVTLKCGHVCPRKCHGFSHSTIICQKPCNDIRPCCNAACDKTCGETHIHSCGCVPKGRFVEMVQGFQNTVLSGASSHRTALPPNQRRPPPPAPRQSIFYGRSNLHTRRPPSKNGSRAHPPRIMPAQNKQATKGWVDFANGGAKVMDNHLGVLANAKDLNSEEVQRALAVVDNGFLSKELLEAKEAQKLKQLDLAEPDLIDFEDEVEEPVEVPSEQQAPVGPEILTVPTGTLIDLSD
ncbi:ATP binding protein [Penicillium malachiteum]|nr:ATP binding protein [Penicillium malachiteum]